MSNETSRQRFATTHWSMVMQPTAPRATDARDALIQLCLRFWYPIYAYVRQCGHSPAVANDITHGFLQHLFRHFREQGMAQAQGRFRQYLLARLHEFLSSDWRSAVAEPVAELGDSPQDLEERNVRDNATARASRSNCANFGTHSARRCDREEISALRPRQFIAAAMRV
ncbi:MAG TPA: hypothetical protein VLC97_06790 [Rhodanobacteraceae bacterium]|nr:hypothetical protein [Rhodanobacteraceae bacterium]